jgi:hypothetical protein
MTYIERYREAAARLEKARERYAAEQEARVKVEYARRRAEDKAAGRDTSGKSVSRRRTLAHDSVMMHDPEMRKVIDELTAAEDAMIAVRTPA